MASVARQPGRVRPVPVPAGAYPKFTIMGKVFDPEKAAAYANSFAIKKA